MKPDALKGAAVEARSGIRAIGVPTLIQRSFEPSNTSRLEFLDAGRGIAILGVIAVHTVQNFSTGIEQLDSVISTGQFGVQLFYIISAYTMMHILSARVGKEIHLISNFWIRRFFRIAIPFWAGIVVYQGFRLAHVEYFVSTSSDWYSIITSLLLIQGFWPSSMSSIVPGGGSIATEVIFYMLFPLIYLMKGDVLKISVFGVLIITLERLAIRPAYLEVFSLLGLNYPPQDVHKFFHFYIFNQLPVFLCGIVVYTFANDKKDPGSRKVEIIAMLIFFLGFIIASPALSVISLIGASMLFLMIKIDRFPTWLISVGRQSYSLYLFHFAVINVMLLILGDRPGQHSISVFLLGYILAVSGGILVSLVTKPLLEDVGSSMGGLLVNLNERGR